MTNTRLTDPEVLEWRFPVRLDSFAIRRGSGGRGQFPGGNGVVRRIRFLAPMAAAILSNRRLQSPFGMAGGENGKAGRNAIRRTGSDEEQELSFRDEVSVQAGDVLVIETPGGGGYGPPPT
jgi:5-oxoprolinase (ATP-hydrolysing)